MGGGLSAIFSGRRGRLLETGQITSYGEPDDGLEQKGRAKAYDILTSGQYNGTADIDLVHVAVATIAFAATTPGTITDSGNDLAMFKTGETIVISGSGSNDGVYTVSQGNVAGTIRTNEATIFEAAGATVSIAKREAHSNNCVRELNTGLMWSRYTSYTYGIMGTDSYGKMPWTGQLYDIFQYCLAANAASLGGFTDWQVPNRKELCSLSVLENTDGEPDTVTFPSWPTGAGASTWSSSTAKGDTAYAYVYECNIRALITYRAKTASHYCILVRGR